MPWGKCSAGLLQHFVDGIFILIPFFAVSPVFVSDFPAFVRILFAFMKTGKLGIFVDLNPEFYNDSTPVGEVFLEFIDLVVCALPVIFTAEAFKTLNHDTAIPGTVKDRDVAGFRKSGPETP